MRLSVCYGVAWKSSYLREYLPERERQVWTLDIALNFLTSELNIDVRFDYKERPVKWETFAKSQKLIVRNRYTHDYISEFIEILQAMRQSIFYTRYKKLKISSSSERIIFLNFLS